MTQNSLSGTFSRRVSANRRQEKKKKDSIESPLDLHIINQVESTIEWLQHALRSEERPEAAQRGSLLPADARQLCSHPLNVLQSQRIARPTVGGVPPPPPPHLFTKPRFGTVSHWLDGDNRASHCAAASLNPATSKGTGDDLELGYSGLEELSDAHAQEVTVWTGTRPVALMNEAPGDV